MSIIKSITSSKWGGYLLLGTVAAGALVVVSSALRSAINQAVGSNSGKADGASGSDGTTRIDPASNGSVGNATTAHGIPATLHVLERTVDGLFGGGLSRFGGWIGEQIFQPTSASDGPGEGGSLNLSNYNQTNNPYAGGQTTLYADAANAAPTPAGGGAQSNIFGGLTAANPNTQSPLAPSPADQIVWN